MILFKNTKDRTNYYKINIYPTLFGDYLVQKEYGVTHYAKPTNVIKQYASSSKEALILMLDTALDKKSVGYLRTAV